jgi:hypothetical protein
VAPRLRQEALAQPDGIRQVDRKPPHPPVIHAPGLGFEPLAEGNDEAVRMGFEPKAERTIDGGGAHGERASGLAETPVEVVVHRGVDHDAVGIDENPIIPLRLAGAIVQRPEHRLRHTAERGGDSIVARARHAAPARVIGCLQSGSLSEGRLSQLLMHVTPTWRVA